MRINKIFDSIQGEGPATGEPATFIRMSGCNFECRGCDTNHDNYVNMNIEEICKKCNTQDLIIITGGEPAIQQIELWNLVNQLKQEAITEIDIETNGSILIHKSILILLRNVVISPKTKDIDWQYWFSYPNTKFKFVIGEQDWCWSKNDILGLLDRYRNELIYRTWLMPYGTKLDNASKVWDLALKLGVHYSDRLQWRVNRE